MEEVTIGDKMKEKRVLKFQFIKKFLIVMLGIGITEGLINILNVQLVFPFLRDTLGGPVFEKMFAGNMGNGNVVAYFFAVILWGIRIAFPGIIGNPLYEFLNSWVSDNFSGITLEGVGVPVGKEVKNGLYFLGSFLILLLLLLIILLPYLLGAYLFSRLIQNDLNRIVDEYGRQHEEYDKKRSLMLSDIAHDLKTPITTISGYAQAIRDGMITDEEKKLQYLDAICQKSQRMNDLISLLFEYVKIDSAGFSLHKERTDIAEFLRENIVMFYSDFQNKNIEIDPDIPETQVFWDIDRVQFARVIANLLNNDLRHVAEGNRILIRLTYDEDWESIRILLGDTGEAIPKEIAENIFQPFVMGDQSRNSRGGSGLGLSISSKIVKMHGGRLYLDQNSTDEYTKAFVILLAQQN